MILNIHRLMMNIRVMMMKRVNLKMKEGGTAGSEFELCAEAAFGFQLAGCVVFETRCAPSLTGVQLIEFHSMN